MDEYLFALTDRKEVAEGTMSFRFDTSGSDFSFEAGTDPNWPYETGRVDEAILARRVPELTRPVYYLAGPPGMVLALKELLLRRGVSRDNVRFETFSGY